MLDQRRDLVHDLQGADDSNLSRTVCAKGAGGSLARWSRLRTPSEKGVEVWRNAVFRLGEGSFLECLPHYFILFSHCSYQQDTVFLLEGEAIKLTQLNV